MIYSEIPLAQSVVSLCKLHNIKHIIISPGSRNAPLTIGFTFNDYFNCYSIVDERCAAFFALGIAQQTQQPTALVCTSGSALLNYFPAIAEAFYSRIPIVVLSADRPKHLVNIGDGQTITQKNIYSNHVFYNANLKEDIRTEDKHIKEDELPIFKSFKNGKAKISELKLAIHNYNETELDNAILYAKTHSGPVHVNIPFNEPLYGKTSERNELTVKLQSIESTNDIDDSELSKYQLLWQKAKKKIILVGVLQPNSLEQKWLAILAKDNSVIILTETTSNLHHDSIFPSIDKLISPLDSEEFKQLQPEILLTFGGLIVSKKIKRFLRTYKPLHHWHVDRHQANDTFFALNKHFKIGVNQFFSKFLKDQDYNSQNNYKPYWLELRTKRRLKHDLYVSQIPFSDFTVFNSICKSIPEFSQLQVGNSSAIRYTQLFQLKKNITVFCNRGTSGIDGSTSTAIGAAVAIKQRVTFVTGDLSFFYDSNALWNNYIPNSFRIIVVNNNGGGIFRILPGHKNSENFDTYFETKHNLNASHLCKMYNFEYINVNSQEQLDKELVSFYNESKTPKLLEITTPSLENDKILLDYFNFIK